MLAFNDEATCGYRASTRVSGGDGKMSGSATLFSKPEKSGKDWSIKLPLGVRIRGMALTEKRLYVAGRLYDTANSKPRNVVRIYDMATGKMARKKSSPPRNSFRFWKRSWAARSRCSSLPRTLPAKP